MTGFSFGLGRGSKPKMQLSASKPVASAAFAADSDDEELVQGPDAKRSRREPAEPSNAHSAPESETQKVADKLADFVAKNGRKFEEVTRDRNAPDGPFRFLFEVGSPDHRYYIQKLREAEQRIASQAAGSRPKPAPPLAPEPVALPSRPAARMAGHSLAPAQPVQPPEPLQQGQDSYAAAAAAAAAGSAAKAAAAGDSLAAMEAFAQVARKQEEARGIQEREERVDHLNDTSFDRRRKVAVYKTDGKRGHHMQDFIPQEELTNLLSASGDKLAQEQAAALEQASRIQADNVGHKLLSMMGWKDGEGLGAAGGGRAAPVSAVGEAAGERRGLGTKAHTDIEEGDDAFDQYRKRMMLGYKHRPNPLGNPRKSYY